MPRNVHLILSPSQHTKCPHVTDRKMIRKSNRTRQVIRPYRPIQTFLRQHNSIK